MVWPLASVVTWLSLKQAGHEAIIGQARKLWVFKNGRPVAREGHLLIAPKDRLSPGVKYFLRVP